MNLFVKKTNLRSVPGTDHVRFQWNPELEAEDSESNKKLVKLILILVDSIFLHTPEQSILANVKVVDEYQEVDMTDETTKEIVSRSQGHVQNLFKYILSGIEEETDIKTLVRDIVNNTDQKAEAVIISIVEFLRNSIQLKYSNQVKKHDRKRKTECISD